MLIAIWTIFAKVIKFYLAATRRSCHCSTVLPQWLLTQGFDGTNGFFPEHPSIEMNWHAYTSSTMRGSSTLYE